MIARRASYWHTSAPPFAIRCARVHSVDSQHLLTFALLQNTGTDEKVLVLDTLAIHVIRKIEDSTIISYHPNTEGSITSSCGLHARFRLAGKSVYWQDICKKSKDPTFLLLVILWHAVYAWDEALGMLYTHICYLVSLLSSSSRGTQHVRQYSRYDYFSRRA
jgi:hypothetical protein